MSKNLILHVGGPKTGTKSVQEFLYSTAPTLAMHDILVPNFFSDRGCNNELIFQGEKSWQILSDYFRESRFKTLFLSSELMSCYLETPQILNTFFKDIKVDIVFVSRPPGEVIMSHYFDRVTEFGDTFTLQQYSVDRRRWLFPSHRYSLHHLFPSLDINLLEFASHFDAVNAEKHLLIWDKNVASSLLRIIVSDLSSDIFSMPLTSMHNRVDVGTLFCVRDLVSTSLSKSSINSDFSTRRELAKFCTKKILAETSLKPSVRISTTIELNELFEGYLSDIEVMCDRYEWTMSGSKVIESEVQDDLVNFMEFEQLGISLANEIIKMNSLGTLIDEFTSLYPFTKALKQ